MSVIFTSTIKIDENKSWYIELKDMVDERVENCIDLEEYAQKVEEFGADYGGQIDKVNWYKDDNVPPHVMDEIRVLMAEQQEKIEAEKKSE